LRSLDEFEAVVESQVRLGDPDLSLTVHQVRVKLTVLDSLAIGLGPEDVADLGTVSVWQVGHLEIDSRVAVSGHDEHVALAEGEEVVAHVALHVLVLPNLGSLACLVDLCHILVHVGVRVHGVPK